VRRLLQIALDLDAANLIDPDVFEEPLAYWRTHYFPDGEPSRHWPGLHMDRTTNRNQALARSVLTGEEGLPVLVLQALLLIVYRLRNNLFHGEKWAYGILGQRDNFNHAYTVMMGVLDVCRGRA
jgi:hypothetical protein